MCSAHTATAMDTAQGWTVADEAGKECASRDELVGRLAQAIPADGTVEPLEGGMLRRASAPTAPA